ncbi:down syndrome cell adhesion molecule-like protein Dscam2, partial [Trichonephila clavata]
MHCEAWHTRKLVLFVYWVSQQYQCRAGSTDPLTKGPSFISEPPNRVEFSNVSGTVVSCVAEGRPRPVITWVKSDGEVIHDLPGLRHTRHDGALVFPPFSPEDYRADVHAAVYRCILSNSVGTIGSKDVHVRA